MTLLPNAPNRDTRVFAGDVPLLQIAPLPRLDKRRLHPSEHCAGCGRKFEGGEPCYADRAGPGRRTITYCLDCEEEGWPCRGFEVVIHK